MARMVKDTELVAGIMRYSQLILAIGCGSHISE